MTNATAMSLENQHNDKRAVWSWAMYDWANSSFSTTVAAGFFPIFFKQYWSAGTDATVSTAKLAATNSIAHLTLAFISPLLGAASDAGAFKKRLLFAFCMAACACSAGLALVGQGSWILATLVFSLALMANGGQSVFYEALLPSVANDESVDQVSALGYALGYLGGGLLFAVNVWMFRNPAAFGLASSTDAVRASFVTVAFWWAFFAIPIFLFVREAPALKPRAKSSFREGVKQLKATLAHRHHLKTIFVFLIAYWIYIDGVGTIVKMGVDYGLSLGIGTADLITALLITQFVGFPTALFWGWLGSRWDTRKALLVCVASYFVVTLIAVAMTKAIHFYMMAVLVGAVQGGVQSLSRSFYARLVPARYSGEFFALFNLLGRFASVAGPILMAVMGLVSGNPRYGVASVSVLFVIGGCLLWRTNEEQGKAELQAYLA